MCMQICIHLSARSLIYTMKGGLCRPPHGAKARSHPLFASLYPLVFAQVLFSTQFQSTNCFDKNIVWHWFARFFLFDIGLQGFFCLAMKALDIKVAKEGYGKNLHVWVMCFRILLYFSLTKGETIIFGYPTKVARRGVLTVGCNRQSKKCSAWVGACRNRWLKIRKRDGVIGSRN